MDSRESRERLLEDVLGPVPGVGLEAGLAEMRRRRARVRLIRALACAACLTAAAAIWLSPPQFPPLPASEPSSTPAYLLRTRPLRPEHVVTSRGARVRLVPARQTAVSRVLPRPLRGVLTDAELLDAFRGCPVALLSTGPGLEEVVFLDPSDRDRFLGRPDRQ